MSETIRKVAILAAVGVAFGIAMSALQSYFPDSVFASFASSISGVVSYLGSYLKQGRELVNLFFYNPADVTIALTVFVALKPILYSIRFALNVVTWIKDV